MVAATNNESKDKPSSNVQNVAPYYEANPDDRIRIAIKYKSTWRLIFWFQVKKDGSIYAGPRYEEITYVARGVKQVKGPGNVRLEFKYDEGERITNPDILKGTKMSFHGSGLIRAVEGRILGKSLRHLTKQELLCYVLFSHPSNFAPISQPQIRKRDVLLDYPIDEGRPLQAYLIVSPLSNSQLSNGISLAVETDAVYQAPLIFGFPKMGKDISAIAVELLLYHRAMGPWPPYTYLLFTGAH